MIVNTPNVILTAGLFYLGCVALAGPACLTISLGVVIFQFLATWLFKSEVSATANGGTSRARLLDPGTEFTFRIGPGYYEFDNFIRSNHPNETWADPEVQKYLADLRARPAHTAVYTGNTDGTSAISVAMDHDQVDDAEDVIEKRDEKKHKFKKSTYTWTDNNHKRYNKLTRRQNAADELAKGLADYISNNQYKAYCVSFNDNTKPEKDVNHGTLKFNKGKGMIKQCLKLN